MVILIWIAQAVNIGFNSDSFGGLALTVSASILNRFVE